MSAFAAEPMRAMMSAIGNALRREGPVFDPLRTLGVQCTSNPVHDSGRTQ
jgi:hypothetical protein